MRRMTDAPYRLKLLGGLGLEGPTKLSGRVAQRRQLALLALLAGHENPLTRDKLIGFLWPEASPDRARHQLSDALYVIRKELGEDALLVTSDAVQLNEAVVASDLAEFRAARFDESYAEALANYGGPFLDGFFPDESEPFERWMADERASLGRAAARAAWTLADQAEETGEVHEAIRWARRGLQIVPDDERGVRHLIRLQGAMGNRAGAVRTYQEFADRILAELDVQPSEETQALLAAVREGRDPARTNADRGSEPSRDPFPEIDRPETEARPVETAARSVHVAAGDDAPPDARRRRPSWGVWTAGGLALAVLVAWLVIPGSEGGSSTAAPDTPAVVAVLPFEVRGEGLEVWREGMVDLLSTNLDVFSDVRAVPSRTVLAAWRQVGDGGPTDLAGSLAVARGIPARYAVVNGSVIGTREGLRLRAELFDVRTGDRVGGAVVEGAPDSIFALVDRLSVAVMEPLLTSSSEAGRFPRLASVTTSSPTALQAFLEGEALHRTDQPQLAIEAYKRAIEADSTFALAYYRLSEAYTWTTSAAESREPARMAVRYADRLPEQAARLIRAWALSREGLSREWVEALREAIREHPDDAQAWYWLGEAYYHVGGEMLVRPWEFVDAFERSIELDPSFAPAYAHLVDAAFQRDDRARAVLLNERKALVAAEDSLDFRDVTLDLAFGGIHAPDEVRARLRVFSSVELRWMATHGFAHPRFLDLRETALRFALERPTPNWERAIKAWLFWTLVARGHLEAAIELTEDPLLEGDRATMLYEARAIGYPIPEEILARALAHAPARPSDRRDGWSIDAPAVFERGARAAERGDWTAHAAAMQEFRELIPTIEPGNATDTLRVQGLVEALDGYAAWRRGEKARAVALLRRGQESTLGGAHLVRGIMGERNQIIRAWLGELLLEMDRPREALVYYESLGPGWPISQDPMSYFHIGRIRDRLGDPDGAREAYELAALAWQDPDPDMRPLAAEARREAARLAGVVPE